MKIVSIKDIDSHYIIKIFNKIKIKLRHKSRFDYKQASEYGVTQEKRDVQLVVSLTTFPARIDSVKLTINTLLRQTVKPDRLILWLANEQFPQGYEGLPQSIKDLTNLGLEIKWCEDLRSYKKLVPTLREFPNDIIVTADDDILYKEDWLESLYEEYLKNPKNLYVRRARNLYVDDKRIKAYPVNYDIPEDLNTASFKNRLAGGSGCLFPPKSLHEDILNTEQIKSLIPTHDDVYFWAMAVLNKTKTVVIRGLQEDLYTVEEMQKTGLCKINRKGQAGMTIQEAYDRIVEKYPQIVDILSSENN